MLDFILIGSFIVAFVIVLSPVYKGWRNNWKDNN